MWSRWRCVRQMLIFCGPSSASSAPSARMPVPASRMTRDPFAVTSTHVVLPPVRTVSGPGVAIEPRHPQILTRTASPTPCSQKMTMIPWNSSSGPNSGNAVVAISRLTPSSPVIERLPCAGRRSVKAMPPGISSRRSGWPSAACGASISAHSRTGISPVSAKDRPAIFSAGSLKYTRRSSASAM